MKGLRNNPECQHQYQRLSMILIYFENNFLINFTSGERYNKHTLQLQKNMQQFAVIYQLNSINNH